MYYTKNGHKQEIFSQKEFIKESNIRNGKVTTQKFLKAELHRFKTILGYHPNLGIFVKEDNEIHLYFWNESTNNFILFPAVNPIKEV